MGNLENSEQWEQVETSSVGVWRQTGIKVYFKEKTCVTQFLKKKKVEFRQVEPVRSIIWYFPIVIHLH